ncbi:MAG: endonuclease III [Nanoarchaeota archaeon]|nr:endonuclease III [Nanoarchaeota archaeon]
MVIVDEIYKILSKEVPKYQVPIVELVEAQTKDPFKILITTILSARTKDKTTAFAVNKLFKKVNNANDLNKLKISEIEKLIYPVGFYRNKAKFLKKLPGVLDNEFNGEIPAEIDGLVKLPGVGRKTANLVRAVAFQKPAICVDVHVHRISNRFGYVKTKTPFETEMALRKKLPKKYWLKWNYLLVAFGQNLCRPISPHCYECPIKKYCKQVGVKISR